MWCGVVWLLMYDGLMNLARCRKPLCYDNKFTHTKYSITQKNDTSSDKPKQYQMKAQQSFTKQEELQTSD